MDLIIPDSGTDARMLALEQFLERFLGPRGPEFGTPDAEIRRVQMPAPLQRFFRFAGRWPGQNPRTPFANRFCMQDTLCATRRKEYVPELQLSECSRWNSRLACGTLAKEEERSAG